MIKEHWKELKSDIDFSKYEPFATYTSLHIYEERYKIDDKVYRLLYTIGDVQNPIIEIKWKNN
jgi:hypothetical protein